MSKGKIAQTSPSSLIAIGTALPAYTYKQAELTEALLRQVPLPDAEALKVRRMAIASCIATRHLVLPDYAPEPTERLLYPNAAYEPTPSLEDRMRVFHQQAPKLALEAIHNCLDKVPDISRDRITHLLAVSCTGLAAPGLDLMLMQALELPAYTHRSCLYFMGCYAALHALKQADAICKADPQAVVLLVCVELCSLHFQKDETPDNLAASLLFSDGAAAALLTGAAVKAELKQPALQLDGFYSEVAFAGWQDMAWNLSSTGFLMRLSSYIPDLLAQGIRPLIERALERLGLQGIDAVDHWAMHPGGRKILDLAAYELGLDMDCFAASYAVLKACGNMSSPTVLFVLESLWQQLEQGPEGKTVLAAAFGPGLTMETLTASWQL